MLNSMTYNNVFIYTVSTQLLVPKLVFPYMLPTHDPSNYAAVEQTDYF